MTVGEAQEVIKEPGEFKQKKWTGQQAAKSFHLLFHSSSLPSRSRSYLRSNMLAYKQLGISSLSSSLARSIPTILARRGRRRLRSKKVKEQMPQRES